MNRNVGSVDRMMRLFLSLLAFAAVYVHRDSQMAVRILTGVGLFLIASAILRWDPLYNIGGVNTANKE